MNNCILSIGLLASNRKDTIARCLESLRPIREAIPCELIILDTGCDADVRAILEKNGDIVDNFTWCNDFSAARNASLALSHGEWFMYLDDDEWFTDVTELIDFFTSGEYKQYEGASYVQRNYLDMEATQYTDTWVARMAKRTDALHFASKIHEYLTPIHGKNKNLHAVVDHFGYVYPTYEAKKRHFDRNRVLLEDMIAEEPKVLRWKLQLLQEYRTMDDYAMMEKLGWEGLDFLNTEERDDFEAQVYLGSFYAAIALAKMGIEDYQGAGEICSKAREDKRNTRLCHAFLCGILAKACFYLGLVQEKKDEEPDTGHMPSVAYAEAEEYAKQYVEHLTYYKEHAEELYSLQVAPFVGECFDVVKVKEVYSILICAGLKQENTSYLSLYGDELHWDEPNVYVFEEIVGTLIEAMNTLPVNVALPDGHNDNNNHQEDFTKILTIMYAHGALWEYFCSQVEAYAEEGHDIQPLMHVIAQALPEAVTKEDAPIKETAQSNTIDREVSAELQQLAEQIKEQLHLLIQSGMKEQAKEIIEKVKGLIPYDEEIKALEEAVENITK